MMAGDGPLRVRRRHGRPGVRSGTHSWLRADGVRLAGRPACRLPIVFTARPARVWNPLDPLEMLEGRSGGAKEVAFAALLPHAALGGVSLRRLRVSLWTILVGVLGRRLAGARAGLLAAGTAAIYRRSSPPTARS
jgi:hypothetical protein